METDDMSTDKYFALLEQQKAQLNRAQAYKGQKPPASMKRSRSTLQQEFYMLALQDGMRDLMLLDRHNIRSCFIGAAYPPCTLPLSSLAPIHLRDLTLETQHRGRVLIVRAFCEPHYLASIQNAVEDELGDVNRLAIYNLLPTTEPSAVLPQGAVVAIKEPYYKCTADGGVIVRVDHPTDFVLLRPGNSIIPRVFDVRIKQIGQSAIGLKEEANSKFMRGDFREAVEIYSDALDACGLDGDDGDLRRDLCRNRAAANLRLGRYELAIKDAMASINSAEDISEAAKSLNIKALYRAGKAAYEMQDFAQAKQLFGQALELDGSNKESRNELFRTLKRISEQENGKFDFSLMARSVTKQHHLLDHASFLRRVKVAQAGSRGRGLFATEMLKPGDIVFVEKAFYIAHDDGECMLVLLNINTNRVSIGTDSLRLQGTVDKMIWNPTLANQYIDLFDGGKFGNEKELKMVDGRVAVDTFRVQAIAELNGFGCPRVKSRDKKQLKAGNLGFGESTGIWLQASYANHSCLPNATRAFIGDMMIVRALRDIPVGGEILMQYVPQDKPFEERQDIVKNHYGFKCDCDLCHAEAKVPKATIVKRARLRKEIDSFLSENGIKNLNNYRFSAVKRARAKKLLEEIRETYPKAYYERLPRFDCWDINLWSIQTAPLNPQKLLASSLDILRDMGYFVNIRGRKVTIDRKSAIQHDCVIHAAMYAAECLREVRNEGAASALVALGREVYAAMSGAEQGFEQDFKI
ncbi:TPR domain-containing protein [Trichoderma gamsii]|uniref:TPR domain-containing protein n=1 Tax=Trichoderma gamsii TaxID=398673 RepID=A0A2P4ZWJ9_9HYPO|nr:TPR domain-containing protein [Trichoderma gamsii]PON28656.1 TPR domain-containing protein [Trichoderma gamsii]